MGRLNGFRWRLRPLRARGDGQLLLLAGILLALAFVTTAITMSHIGDLERQVSQDQRAPLLTEYRFVRSMVGTTLDDAVTAGTTDEEFDAAFESMADLLRSMATDKGYVLSVALASGESGLPTNEWNHTRWGWQNRVEVASPTDPDWYNAGEPIPEDGRLENGGTYSGPNPYWLHSFDGRVLMGPDGENIPWDGSNDGIVWGDCSHLVHPTDCIRAIVVYLRLESQDAVIEEYVVYALNA